jgi:hypothetical protein
MRTARFPFISELETECYDLPKKRCSDDATAVTIRRQRRGRFATQQLCREGMDKKNQTQNLARQGMRQEWISLSDH